MQADQSIHLAHATSPPTRSAGGLVVNLILEEGFKDVAHKGCGRGLGGGRGSKVMDTLCRGQVIQHSASYHSVFRLLLLGFNLSGPPGSLPAGQAPGKGRWLMTGTYSLGVTMELCVNAVGTTLTSFQGSPRLAWSRPSRTEKPRASLHHHRQTCRNSPARKKITILSATCHQSATKDGKIPLQISHKLHNILSKLQTWSRCTEATKSWTC